MEAYLIEEEGERKTEQYAHYAPECEPGRERGQDEHDNNDDETEVLGSSCKLTL